MKAEQRRTEGDDDQRMETRTRQQISRAKKNNSMRVRGNRSTEKEGLAPASPSHVPMCRQTQVCMAIVDNSYKSTGIHMHTRA